MGKASKAGKPVSLRNAEKTCASSNSSGSSLSKDLIADYLPPIGLVMIVMLCSGTLFVFAMRDVLATGRSIAGTPDDAFLEFTRSTEFFDDTKGWKSTQGGLSSIQPITTDANNMGGLFVRKIGGAAALAVHTQKLMPLLFQTMDSRWKMGHFRPLFWLSSVANLAIAAFYASYMDVFVSAGADRLPKLFIFVLVLETIVVLGFLFSAGKINKGPAVAMKDGKTSRSITSRIVARTIFIISTAMSIIASRDLFFPGEILHFIPRDDIYLEWTGVFLHSPPEGSPEAREYGMTSAFQVGDKYLSQFLALHILLLCMYKFATAFAIRYGSDGGGLVKCRMIWKVQALGDGLLLFLFRLFAPAALSASLDLRWHLMCIAFEGFILGLYGFF